jgi:hypothetical protein
MGIGKSRPHQAATEEDDSVAVWISEVRKGETMRLGSSRCWICRKDIASVKTYVREEFQNFYCGLLQAHVSGVDIRMQLLRMVE